MTTTTFVDGTVVEADWLNDVDETVYTIPRPRAFVKFTNSGSVAIVASYNIASVVRSSAGVVVVTMTTAPDAGGTDYYVVVTGFAGSCRIATVSSVNELDFTVLTWDAAGAAADSGVSLVVFS